jgi:predicted RND superfamily exporter protein
MATFGHPVDMVSSGLFSIVTVAVIEDFFFLSHWRMNNPYTNWRTGFGMLVLPSFFTSLTTMIGFGSLYAAHLLTIRRLGLWAAVGAILEWVILFFVLPSVLKAWPSLQNWTNASRARGLSVLQRLTNKTPPRWVALLCLLLIPIGLVTIPYLHVSDDLRAVFRSDHPFSSTINYMERTRGWVYDASLVFRSEVPQDKVESILRAVKTLPEVKRVLSPWDILADATKGLPRSVAGIVETDFQTTSFNDRFYAKSGDVHVSVYMQQSSLDSFYSLRKLIEGSCPQNECFLAGPMTSYEEICGKLIPTLLESAGVSLALVAFVLFALCYAMRSLKSAPALVLSSLWCASVMIGLMALFQIPVNFLSCIVAAVLLGLAGDNGIMYLMTARPGQLKSGIASMSVASFQVTITAVAAVLVLSLSDLEPSRTLAKLCALGLTLNLFGDLWLLKGLVIDSKEEVGLNKR